MTKIPLILATLAEFRLATTTRIDHAKKQLEQAGASSARVTVTHQENKTTLLVEGQPQIQYSWRKPIELLQPEIPSPQPWQIALLDTLPKSQRIRYRTRLGLYRKGTEPVLTERQHNMYPNGRY